MGWVREQFEESAGAQRSGARPAQEFSLEARIRQKWNELLQQFQGDVEEFRRANENAGFEQLSELKCRISNSTGQVAVMIVADPESHTVRYTYEPESKKTAVPEEGILTFRPAGNAVRIYSSDQRLSMEQARQLILSPVFFPAIPTDQTAAA
jgi:hypothetical protein